MHFSPMVHCSSEDLDYPKYQVLFYCTMDIITTLVVVGLVIFLLFTFCGWCCRKQSSETTFTTVTVPNVSTSTVPSNANPPYPVQSTMMPLPSTGGHVNPVAAVISYPSYVTPGQQTYPPQPGFISYPMVNQMPYPQYHPSQQGGFNTGPYPPYPGYPPAAGSSMQQNPPSYDEATSGPGGYNKQSPYNPDYKGH